MYRYFKVLRLLFLTIAFSLLVTSFLNASIRYDNASQVNVLYKGARLNLVPEPVTIDGVLYVPLRNIARDMGLEIEYDRNRDSFKVYRPGDNREISFRLNRKEVMVNGQSEELNYPVRLIRNSHYLPLNDFLWLLGYFINQNGQDYSIVSKIKGMSWENKTLIISGMAPLEHSVEYIDGAYHFWLHNTILGMHQNELSVADGVVKSIAISQQSLNPARVLVKVTVAQRIKYMAFKEDADNALRYVFDYVIPEVPLVKTKPAVPTLTAPIPKVNDQDIKKVPVSLRQGEQAVADSHSAKVIVSTGANDFPTTQSLWIAEAAFANGKPKFLVVNGEKYGQMDVLFENNNAYVKFDSLFGYLGCELQGFSGENPFKADLRLIISAAPDKNLVVQAGKAYLGENSWDYRVVSQGKDIYLPLVSTLRILGYAAYFDDSTLYVNSRINSIDYVEIGGKREVIIKGNGRLLAKDLAYLKDPPRAILDIPNSGYDVPLNYLRPQDQNIKIVRGAQFDRGVTRIALDLESLENRPEVEYRDGGQTIALVFGKSSLQRLAVDDSDPKRFLVGLYSDHGKISTYSLVELDNPKRLVVTIDNMANKLEQDVWNYSKGVVSRVRASQFSWDPLQARVVIDLNESEYRSYAKLADGTLVVSTAEASPAVASKSPVVVVTPPKDMPKVVAPPSPPPVTTRVEETMTTQRTDVTVDAKEAVEQSPPPAIERSEPASRIVSDVEQGRRTLPQVAKTESTPVSEPVSARTKSDMELLRGVRVAIIPGHGGSDPGAISRSGYMEKIPTLELSLKVQRLLSAAGAIPLLSREKDEHVSLEQQAQFANSNKADILISIHFNSFISESARGAESYYYKPVDYALAKAVHQEIASLPGLNDKGLKKAMMHNLNHTTMPGVVLEPLFISNRREEQLIKDDAFQWKLARAIVKGMATYMRNKQEGKLENPPR